MLLTSGLHSHLRLQQQSQQLLIFETSPASTLGISHAALHYNMQFGLEEWAAMFFSPSSRGWLMRLIAFRAATGSLLPLALEAPVPMGSSSPSITVPTRSLYALCCSRNSPASTFMACAQQGSRCQAALAVLVVERPGQRWCPKLPDVSGCGVWGISTAAVPVAAVGAAAPAGDQSFSLASAT
jgi:hypothetical protein